MKRSIFNVWYATLGREPFKVKSITKMLEKLNIYFYRQSENTKSILRILYFK